MNEILYTLIGLLLGVLLAAFLHRRFGVFDDATDAECGISRTRAHERVPDDYPEGRIPGPRGPLGID